MELRLAEGINVKGKRVILRVAFDVHFIDQSGVITIEDDTRLKSAIPTINDLTARGAKVILMSWLQRPGGQPNPDMSLVPVAEHLAKLLGRPVLALDDCIGEDVLSKIESVPDGSVIMLENVRFHPGEKDEKTLDEDYAKELAKNGDLFINDAFGQSHRDVSSITGILKYLPSYAGPQLQKEVEALSGLLDKPARPFVGIIGGAKISTKLEVICSLLDNVDELMLGGALANTILLAQGMQVGTSLIEESMIAKAKALALTDTRLHIPVDVITAKEATEDAETFTRAVGNLEPDEKILDIGPDTVKLFQGVIKSAKTIIWNGPMGWYEIKKFSQGTSDIAEALASADAHTVIGGGETISSVSQLGLEGKMSFISMGGGAMLKFLEKGTLPGIKPLIKE